MPKPKFTIFRRRIFLQSSRYKQIRIRSMLNLPQDRHRDSKSNQHDTVTILRKISQRIFHSQHDFRPHFYFTFFARSICLRERDERALDSMEGFSALVAETLLYRGSITGTMTRRLMSAVGYCTSVTVCSGLLPDDFFRSKGHRSGFPGMRGGAHAPNCMSSEC